MGVPCFLIVATDRMRLGLRRYSYDRGETVEGVASTMDTSGYADDDPRWPVKCERCDYRFRVEDERQVWTDTIYAAADGRRMALRDAPPGAMWDADWLAEYEEYRGPDGKCLIVRLPNKQDWAIDSRAANCDSPCKTCGQPYHAHKGSAGHPYEDSQPQHKCWVRHGTPPVLTVDKIGVTCGAGGGSIASGSGEKHWHGFLRDGSLVP